MELAELGEFKPESLTPIARETVSKKTDSRSGYNTVADTKGTLLWNSDDQYDKPHIILTSEQVSMEYLSYLDEVIILIGAGIDGRASFPPVFNRNDKYKKLLPEG